MTTTNGWEAAGREAKAARMADVLSIAGVTADLAALTGSDFWLTTAKTAGIKSALVSNRAPSAATWELVVEKLRAHERFASSAVPERRSARGPVNPSLMVD